MSASPGALLGLDTTWVPEHLAFYAALNLNLANDELVVRGSDGRGTGPLRLRFISTLGVGLGLADQLDLQFTLPLHTTEALLQDRSTEVGLGDLKVSLRWRPLFEEVGFGLAAQVGLWLPTGGAVPFSSDGGVVVDARVIADWRWASGAVVAAHVGFRARPSDRVLDLALDDELRFGLGAEVPMSVLGTSAPLSLLAEVEGALGFGDGDFDPDDGFSSRKTPIEGRVGLRVRTGAWAFTGAGGFGLTDGYGTPDYRAVLQVGWAGGRGPVPEPAPRDPEVASTGRADTRVAGLAAPTFPPAPTFAAAGGAGGQAALSALFDQAIAADPDPDNDGVTGDKDRCPYEPEDVDGFQDEDGCPDPDNDGDGVPDTHDQCPTELETPNGFQDEDGCPDEGEASVVATEGAIELAQTIEFKSGSNVLANTATGLLDQIAAVLKANPQVRRVRIEGHTDNQGDEEMNVDLSERRAERVRLELVNRGVARERLLPRGFGSTRPVAPNTTNDGRKKNRRVEFRVIDPPPPGQPRIDVDAPEGSEQDRPGCGAGPRECDQAAGVDAIPSPMEASP